MPIMDSWNRIHPEKVNHRGLNFWVKGDGSKKQLNNNKKAYKTFIISWSSFTGKFIKRFALLLLLKLMNETVTDIYFYNFIFKVLVFARHQAEPLLFNCQER